MYYTCIGFFITHASTSRKRFIVNVFKLFETNIFLCFVFKIENENNVFGLYFWSLTKNMILNPGPANCLHNDVL